MLKSKLNILAFFLLFPLLNACSEKDPFPEFKIPTYTGAYDSKIGFDNSIHGKTVAYHVKETFPAITVTNFYDKFLSEKGFTVLDNPNYTGKGWVKFNRESLKWDIVADSPPARYFRSWSGPHEYLIFKLTLNYAADDKLFVTCFLHPYSDHELFNNFNKWVAETGRDKEFYQLLSKYTKKDHKIDIKRAVKENPDNELIAKFAKTAEQNKQNIDSAYKSYKEAIRKE